MKKIFTCRNLKKMHGTEPKLTFPENCVTLKKLFQGENMTCPVCGKKATTFIRFLFSLEGVNISQSLKGNIKCYECKTLLHIKNYEKRLWVIIFFADFFAILLGLSPGIFKLLETTLFGIVIGVLIYAGLPFSLIYIMGKTLRFEKVERESEIPTQSI